MRRLGLAAASLAVVAVAGCGTSSSMSPMPVRDVPSTASVGFNDPDVLAADIARTVNAKQTDGSSVTIICISDTTPHKFVCNGTWSDDTPSQTVTATVSTDGTTWITD